MYLSFGPQGTAAELWMLALGSKQGSWKQGAGMTEEGSLVRLPQVMASGRGRVLQRFALLVIGAALLTCFFGVATASAFETRLLQKSFAPAGGFANFGPQGVAVDQNTETVYVADAGGASVYVFEADGTPASSPKLTEA